MPPKTDLPAPWPEFLSEVDQSLSTPVELHCAGGFVLTAVHGLPRPTGDLDYITIAPLDAFKELERIAGRESKLAKKYKLYFHQKGLSHRFSGELRGASCRTESRTKKSVFENS
jgi:hypothetical protein